MIDPWSWVLPPAPPKLDGIDGPENDGEDNKNDKGRQDNGQQQKMAEFQGVSQDTKFEIRKLEKLYTNKFLREKV